MARRTNKVDFTKGAIYEQNGEFFIEEFKSDSTKTYNLSEYLRQFVSTEDNIRKVNITITEVFDMESSGD